MEIERVSFAVDGRTFTSGADGVARITVTTGGNYITQTRQATSCRQLAVTPIDENGELD